MLVGDNVPHKCLCWQNLYCSEVCVFTPMSYKSFAGIHASVDKIFDLLNPQIQGCETMWLKSKEHVDMNDLRSKPSEFHTAINMRSSGEVAQAEHTKGYTRSGLSLAYGGQKCPQMSFSSLHYVYEHIL